EKFFNSSLNTLGTKIAGLFTPRQLETAPLALAGLATQALSKDAPPPRRKWHADLDFSALPTESAEAEEDRPPSPLRRRLLKAIAASAVVLAGAGIVAKKELVPELLSKLKRTKTPDVVFDPDKVFNLSSVPNESVPAPKPSQKAYLPNIRTGRLPQITPAPTKEPTPTPKPTPFPTPEPQRLAEKEVGNRNFAEFFLGNLTELFKQKRAEKAAGDPSFAERVQKEFLKSDSINFLYLGIDETRERAKEFTRNGLGRSDVMMLVSFDPHTFKTTAISFPRDLFSPELVKYFGRGARINAVTMSPHVDKKADPFEIARHIVESATGIPVDGVIETNIDFMQGFMQGADNFLGIFDSLFPDGLEITVPKRIVDGDYPVGYATKRLVFEPGKQKMKGRSLTEYARTRHSDSDFQRADRQRQILKAAIKDLFPRILTETAKGNTKSLDEIIKALEKQEQLSNLFFDINIAEVVKTLRDNLIRLRNTPSGVAVLGVLAANTADEIDRINKNGEGFASFGVNEMTESMGPSDAQYLPYVHKIRGAKTDSKPTKQGNYLAYWQSLRERVYKLVQEGGALSPLSETAPQIKGGLIKDIIAPLVAQRVETERKEKKRDPEWTNRVDEALNGGRMNLLLIGEGYERAWGEITVDAVVAASYLRGANALNLISLHRDTLVPETGEELMKVAQKGGIPLTKTIVEKSTGLSMDYYVKLTFKGVAKFIDRAFGTLEVDVPQEIDDKQPGTHIYFPAGKQRMNGEQIQLYMRSRETTSVERRNTAQQQVLEVMMNKIMTRLKTNNLLQNIAMLNNIKTSIAELTKSGDIETDLDIEGVIDETFGKWFDIASKFVGSRITGEQFFDMPKITGLVVADYDMLAKVPGDTGPREALRTYRDPKTKEPILGDPKDKKFLERFYEVPRARVRQLLQKQTASSP
ncbi:MAG: LCP family protein, partial [bacterium]|nr:LCP family protein [bacterium]